MQFMTIQEAADKWGITARRIQVLCSEGRLDGAEKFGRQWAIPVDTEKPSDARIKCGKYIKTNADSSIIKPKIFSFFSGSGFLDLGFETSNYDIVFVNEFYTPFIDAYRYSREKMDIPEPKYGYYNGDINDFLTDKKSKLHADILDARSSGSLVGFIGGPPCPDFSVAGKNKGSEGDNGKLSQSYVDLIIAQKPDFFLFENVKGLWKTARHREFYEKLKTELLGAGYVITDRLTNSLEYGAAQDRDRILMFGIQKSLLSDDNAIDNFPWTQFQSYDLQQVKSQEWPSTNSFQKDSATTCPSSVQKELTIEYWFKKNDVYNHPNANDYFIPRQGIVRMQAVEEGDVSRKCYKRPHRWRYSPTAAYGNNEVHLHPYKERRMSAAETLAIQALPKEFELPPDMTLTDKFKTIGNGVPYVLAEGIAKTILKFLKDNGCLKRHPQSAQ